MHEELKKSVCDANIELHKENLVIYSWGNVSGIDREKGVVAIKPSGVSYEELTADKIVLVDLDGQNCRREPQAILRYADASGAIQKFQRNRRYMSRAFNKRDGLGAGVQGNTVLRHHARGLFLRPHTRYRADD